MSCSLLMIRESERRAPAAVSIAETKVLMLESAWHPPEIGGQGGKSRCPSGRKFQNETVDVIKGQTVLLCKLEIQFEFYSKYNGKVLGSFSKGSDRICFASVKGDFGS